VNRNSWHPDRERNQGSFDEPVYWMTRDLEDGWRVTARLVTNQYRTVIDRIHIEAGDATELVESEGASSYPPATTPTRRGCARSGGRRGEGDCGADDVV
jgi:hypothetical protein